MSQTLSQISTQTGFAHLTDLPCLKLVCGEASAVISLYGAQLLSYQPAPGRELLWLSPKAVWQQQQAIRGGVPVCWPWFGPAGKPFNTSAAKLPNHGLVRNRLWRQVQAKPSTQQALVTLSIKYRRHWVVVKVNGYQRQIVHRQHFAHWAAAGGLTDNIVHFFRSGIAASNKGQVD